MHLHAKAILGKQEARSVRYSKSSIQFKGL